MPSFDIPLPQDKNDRVTLHQSATFGTVLLIHNEERIPKNFFTGRAQVRGAQSQHLYEIRVRNVPGRIYPRVYIDGEQIRFTKPAPNIHEILLTAAFVALFPGMILAVIPGLGITAMSYIATRWMLTDQKEVGFNTILVAVIVVVTYFTVLALGAVRILAHPV